MVDPWFYTTAYDEELCDALVERGHEVVLIGADSDVDVSAGFVENSPVEVRRIFRAPPSWLPGPLGLVVKGLLHVVGMLRLLRLLRRIKPDVIHFQWLPLPLVDAAFLPLLARLAPTVATIHDTNPYNGAGPLMLRLGTKLVVSQHAQLIVHNDVSVDGLVAQGYSSETMHKVAHGLPLHDPYPNQRSGEENRSVQLLQFGKIKEYKGVDVLVGATALLDDDRRARCRVSVVGQPYVPTGTLQQLVTDNQLSDVVDFNFEFVDDDAMAKLFADADCLVFPYRSIDTSAVLMQAIARGIPVIASDIGCFSEYLTDGVDAMLVPPDDPAALAKAMATLIDEPHRIDDLREGIVELRGRIPTWADVANATTDVYELAVR